ncbi:polyphosphate kinase 2 [Amylibacter marinus]|uniref:ADP/GDP-polyphosphate phosphotransferase n=1 Tax=Amylibacter marinus TaxID=1475483 RepID=A0ABQ5VTC2_9RHOB|nr:polyphosphate kinase 2 [Amylibacter marinus]GLQ34473.1 polyphosphate kinase 2 [Amylibacter marinus]
MTKPFDGAISTYFTQHAPDDVRNAIRTAEKNQILDQNFPYSDRMKRREYESTLADLQVELVKVQSWAAETGARVVVVFEGRDAAGKGGTIKRFRENLNPRVAKVVALSKPSDTERSEWYFQRYIRHLPSAGEIVMFDRSWYNRGVVEKVFGFCTEKQRTVFFSQVNDFERMLVNDGITVVKLWLNVGRAEQLRRFLDREGDRLKQWKLSGIDVKGLSKWDDYTAAISETLDKSSSDHAPWHVIRTDDKRRARIAAIRTVLSKLPYPQKSSNIATLPDPEITGGPELLSADNG